MKKQFLLLFSILMISSTIFSQEIIILHTNDMHSKLTGYGPENEYSPLVTGNDGTRGGFARLSSIIKATKKSNANTFVFDSGDFLMGSLFHWSEEETGFQLGLMRAMGYEAVCLGNHEFDFGPGTLAKIINISKTKGEIPQLLCSNLIFDPKSTSDDALENLLKDKTILPYTILEKSGIKIGVFGIMGTDAAHVAPASKPVSFGDPIKISKETAKYLKETEKVDIVICLSHSGIYYNSEEKKYYGEDIELAEKVPYIDIILSGHTHVATPAEIKINSTYIVQTGSYAENIGEIRFNFKDKKINDFKYKLIPVDDKINGDKEVYDLIENQKIFINKKYLSEVNLKYDGKIAKTNFDLKLDFNNQGSSNLGPFLADAVYFYANSSSGNTDFSLLASGTIREDLLKGESGILTTADIFRVMSLGRGYDNVPGYPLAKIYLTANEIKKLMEIVFVGRQGGGDSYLFFSGITVYVDSEKGMLRKVQKIEIKGKELDFSKKNKQLYSLAANTYLLSFLGEVKKMSKGLIKLVPKDAQGNEITDYKKVLIDINKEKEGIQEAKEWIAIIKYLEKQNFSMAPQTVLPVVPQRYLEGDKSMLEIKK